MSDSPSLALPYLAAAQAQKHVTVNEALSLLDGLVHLSAVTRTLSTPPLAPVDGDRYLIAAAPTGDWSGHAGHIALRMEGAWRFLMPKEGWRMWIADENALLTFDGSNWIAATVPSSLQNLSMLGVNATADATNRLAISSAAALFNNSGNGVQIKLNKNTASDSASFLFQTGFSARAELGTTGDDSFHLKVSADGNTFQEALQVNGASAITTIRKSLALDPQPGDPASPVNGQLWYNAVSGKFRAQQNNLTIDVAGGSAAWGGITGTLANQTDLQTALNGKASTAHTHSLSAITDVTVSSANLNALDDGVDTALHFHASDRSRANHTGTQLAATISDFAPSAIAATLAGFAAAGARTAVTATDTVLAGFGKVQKYLNDLSAVAFSGSAADLSAGTLPSARLPAFTGDATSTAGSVALTIAAGAVTNAKLATMAAATIKGNASGSAATPADLTAAQVTAILPGFVASGAGAAKGLVPAPSTTPGSVAFLREDGAWAIPAAGGGGGQASIQFQDEGTSIGAPGAITTVNVTGDDHSAAVSGTTLTLDVKRFKRNARWAAVGNATSIVASDAAALTQSVTPATANVAITDAFTEKIRADYLQVTAAATAIATARTAAAMWYRGAAAGRGGFRVRARIGNATGATNATHRAFFGFQGGATTLTDVNPSTLLNMVGLGWDSGDANLSIMSNGGSGTATKTSLGAGFPRPTVDRSVMWDLELSCAPNDTQIAYKVTNLISGVTVSGTLTTNLPVNTTLLAWHMYASAGGTSSVAGFSFSFLEIASDY